MGGTSSVFNNTDRDLLSKIRLIPFEKFEELGTFPRFPENEDIVVPITSLTPEVYNDSLVIFISHCWLRGWPGAQGWDGRPHPDNAEGSKYQLCIEGIKSIKAQLAPGMSNCFVWLDYGCIDQNGDPAGELRMLDKIVQLSDCIFTPIYDSNCQWDYNGKINNMYEDYKSPGWRGTPASYLNRGWCRVEMFYAANIPLFLADNPEAFAERVKKFDHGIAYHQKEGRRPHILFGTHEKKIRLEPFILPPLQNSWFEEYHPEKGHLTKDADRQVIHKLVEDIKPYMKFVVEGYTGDHNSQGQREGHGKYLYDNGESYEGDWKADLKHGKGKYIYADGDYYVGDWVNGKRHGQGKIVSLSNETYEGEFTDGIKHGYGVYLYTDGEKYEGYYAHGKKHGEGKYYFADGEIIRGIYEDGKRVKTLETIKPS